MDTLQGDWQHYSGATAIGYGGFVDCDDNVYKWAGRRISSLANGRKVLDVGCGKCGRLPYFSGARSFVGVEAGQDMVDQIPDDAGVSITRWNGDSGSLGKEIQKSPKLVIHGDMQDVCESEVIRASIASSLFSVICFPDPVVPFKAISAGLKPGGRVVVVSNAMVPSDLGIDDTQSYSGLDVDLQNGVDNIKLPPGTVFRQILHLENCDLALQDHAHTLHNIYNALSANQLSIEEAKIFPPQGCTYVDPEAPGSFTEAHKHFTDEFPVFSQIQNRRLMYAKVCLVAAKR